MSRLPDDPAAFQAFLDELRRARADPRVLRDSSHFAALVDSMRKVLSKNDRLRRYLESADLAQLGLGRLVKHIDGFKGTTWPELLIFARRLTEQAKTDQWRMETAEKRGGTLPSVDISPSIPDENGPTPSRVLSDEEQRELLARAIRELPDDYRRAIELRLANHEYETIAKELGLTTEATRQRVSRGLARIRERFSGLAGPIDL